MVTVGVIANPASGRDIRRLVAGASVFDNAEKGSMVHRLLAGLGATGVERVVMMPAGDGLGGSLLRHLKGRTGALAEQPVPTVEFLDIELHGDARDSADAVEAALGEGATALVVLGGDGTHRVVAKHAGEVPLCTLSTGTNNVFPELREATVAGIATGLVATAVVAGDGLLRREKQLSVEVTGRHDIALVDVAVSGDRWTGARALWRVDDLREAFVTFANPSAVGLSGVAGLTAPVARTAPHGLRLRFAPPARATAVVTVPLAPGLLVPVGVADVDEVLPGETIELEPGAGCLALDGEREIELGTRDRVTVTLRPGPRVIDVDAAMAHAAAHHLLNGGRPGAAPRGRSQHGPPA
jgi:predicted polyphosphate/ATP-dependent NAD kinase